MKENRAERLLEQVKPELKKALSTAPSFGVVSLTIHFMSGKIKRVVHTREESVVPPGADNE